MNERERARTSANRRKPDRTDANLPERGAGISSMSPLVLAFALAGAVGIAFAGALGGALAGATGSALAGAPRLKSAYICAPCGARGPDPQARRSGALRAKLGTSR